MNVQIQLNTALIGRYEVEREIGQGGMATVYLARDVRHDRQVALKVLHPDLAAALGAERFLAEIRTTANLQHPHILPLHDSGEAGGYLYYVMPFVAGETLRTRLERERVLPIPDAIGIAREVLSALDYAHRHGVVHRDIKPENILLHEGSALVADFGIALAVQSAGGQRMTQTGLSLGTPQYMSPEQAMGERQIDGRADIYAVGAVLYEMLTGEPPFSGGSVQAIVAKVLTERPTSPRTVRDTISPSVEASVLQALAKMPADRFASAAQFADALSDDRASYVQPIVARHRAPTPRQRLMSAAAVTVALFAGAALGAMLMRAMRRDSPDPVAHFEFAAPESVTIVTNTGTGVALSPDDKQLAFVGFARGVTRVYVRNLDELRVRPLAGTEGAIASMFSPNGRWIAFFHGSGMLEKIEANGGVPITLGSTTSNTGIDWLDDEAIVIGSNQRDRRGLIRIGAGGGSTATLITHPDSAHGVVDHLWPVVDAVHRLILLTLYDGQSNAASRIGVTSLEGGAVTDLGIRGMAPLGVVNDQLIYVRADGAIMAIPFDPSRRRVTGSAVPVLDPVLFCAICNGDAGVRVSRRGSLVALRGSPLARLVIVNANGSRRVLDDRRQAIRPNTQFSPDGKRVAVPIQETGETLVQDIWVYDLSNGARTKVTSVQGIADYPHWTADGKQLVFKVSTGGAGAMFLQDAAGARRPVRLTSDSSFVGEADVSPDLRHAVIVTQQGLRVSLDTETIGTNKIGEYVHGREQVGLRDAHFSPDGKWLAYRTFETGHWAVYVRPFPGPGNPIEVSDSAAFLPRWLSANRLAYGDGSRIMAATLATSPALHVASKTTLFTNFKATDWLSDISPTGDQVLVLETDVQNTHVEVILNWAQALRERLKR